LGTRGGLGPIQLRTLQLDDLRIHPVTEPIALGLARPERTTRASAADANAKTDEAIALGAAGP